MKTVLLSLLLCQLLWSDFYVVSGKEDIRMQELSSGKIDFSQLSSIPFISASDKTISVRSINEDINSKHLNFRTSSIDLTQQNYVLTEFTTKIDEHNYHTTFGDYEIKEGRMLQLFYHNRWYGVIIGDPIEILHQLFNGEKPNSSKAYGAFKKARIAYPYDSTLRLYEQLWYQRFIVVKEQQKLSHIRDAYRRYQILETDKARTFYGQYIRKEIAIFLKAYPYPEYTKELNTLLTKLK